MNLLIACEESQRVCIEFRRKGHNAFSCDIMECSGGHPEWHIKADVLPLLNGRCEFETMDGQRHSIDGRWDMIIAFVPCTKTSNAVPKAELFADHLISHGVAFAGDNNVLTNGDRIRSMTDEELVAWLDFCPQLSCEASVSCQKCVLNWLKQPVEEEDA